MRTNIHRIPLLCLVIAGVCCVAQNANAQDSHWVATWGCAMQLTEPKNVPPPPGLTSNTLRQIIHASLGGKQLRVRCSNLFGTNAVVLKSVHVALNPGTTASSIIDPTTDKTLTFNDAPSAVIPAGKEILSDTIAFDLPPLANLAISIYFGETSGNITGHPGSRTTSYILPGNTVTSTNMAGAVKTAHWYNITGVEVLSPNSNRTVVVLGDSITDGRGSTTDRNDRWPDELAQRLQANAATRNVAVINMGIGGNAIYGGLGPAAVKRFERDVLNQSGARWLIIFEGVNDIGGNSKGTVATNLIAAYTQFIAKAHARGIRAYGATITPFGGSSYYTTSHEASRLTVNTWIRTNKLCDAVLDFDAVTRDPVRLTNLQSVYDSGDHLHLSPAGYQAMAEAIDPSLFVP